MSGKPAYWKVYLPFMTEAIRTVHFDNYYIGKLPVKAISEIAQKPIIKIVDKILSFTQSNDYLQNTAKQVQVKGYEKQIDQMIYELYGLTEDEIAIVEGKG